MQRNALSARANYLTKEFAKFQCEKLEEQKKRRFFRQNHKKPTDVKRRNAQLTNVRDVAVREHDVPNNSGIDTHRSDFASPVGAILKAGSLTEDEEWALGEAWGLDTTAETGSLPPEIHGDQSNDSDDAMYEDEDEDGVDKTVSFTGGWCKETGKSTSRQHLTDLKLAGFLAEFLQGEYYTENV